jgi:SAM-dependent methyltransferase
MQSMTEPYATEFRRLVRLGAGARDIHGTPEVHPARGTLPSQREEARVEMHRRSSCALLEAFAGRAPRVLEVGCSTGGTAVAIALSAALAPEVVVGVDADRLSLRAAEVRARGHGLGPKRIAFVRNAPGAALPFASESFDLVVCVSVLELVPSAAAGRRLVDEMKRVVRPGGHVFLSTPNPLRLRDGRARRWLGDLVRRGGHPVGSLPWSMRALVADFERVDIDGWTLARALKVPERVVPRSLAGALGWAQPWQNLLVRKPVIPRGRGRGRGREIVS